MTALVFGAAGGIIGGVLGGPIGASIGQLAGSLIGNLIDPPKIQGPRLGDTKLQRSSYGLMIPYAWGTGRIGTIVIDQTDLIEHEHKEGGKGGPEVTNYTYSASWCAALCARLPNRTEAILGITHLFLDGRLIWTQESAEECPCTVYTGSETQEPDPTFEAIHGVGNVPAYRGAAYLVFTDFDLTDYGNRIPNVEAVIFTKGGEIPWRVSNFSAWGTPLHSNFYHACATYQNGVITTVEMGNGADDTFRIRQFHTDGTQIGSTIEQVCPLPGTTAVFAVTNANIFMRTDGSDDHWFYWNETTQAIEQGFTIAGGGSNPTTVGAPMLKIGDSIYSVGHSGFDWSLSRWSAETGAAGALVGSVAVRTATSGYNFAPSLGTSSEDNVIYLLWEDSDGFRMRKVDATDLTTIHSWEPSDLAGTYLEHQGITFHVEGGLICNGRNVSSGVYEIRLVQIDGSYGLANVGGTIPTTGPTPTQSIWLGGGLLLDPNGVYSINPPAEPELLSDIVDDITSLTPVGSADTSELTDEVRWFLLGSEMTARNAIEKLRPPFFFDAVEEDFGIVFRKRGDRTVYEIDDDDLVPFDDSGDLLRTIRKREQELPRTVTMTYIDVDMDWQTGAQSSPRQTTQSQYDVTLEIPVGFTAQEAAQKCWSIQCAEWNERESFQWQTTRKWAKLTPCTLVKVRGRVIRLQKTTEQPDGLIIYEGVLAAPSIYTQTAAGASSGGSVSQPEPASKIGTELVLLDIPVLTLNDAPFGFYAAMGPAADGAWGGATLFKSLDGGVSYNAVASTSSAAVIGTTADYPSPAYSGALSHYLGGDVVEEDSIVVRLHDGDAALESITSTALTNGGNLCAVSRGGAGSPNQIEWEILQFRDATLLDASTYLLTGFKRGRFATSTADHETGDTFVLLPTLNVDAPEQELGVELLYKAVTFGRALSTAAAIPFINTGIGSEEWYGGVDGGLESNQAGYVLTSAHASLPNGRVITAGDNITIDDNGPGSTIVITADIPPPSPSAGGAMTLISSVTTSGTQASVVFSSIPSTYKDLMLVFQARDTNTSNADGSARIVLNTDTTAANYSSTQYTIGSGSTTSTNTAASSTSGAVFANIPGKINQSNAFAAGRVLIPNYAGTTFWKGFLTQYESAFNSSPTISAGVMSGMWKSTSAVNAITVNCSYTAFENGSVFSLYGLG